MRKGSAQISVALILWAIVVAPSVMANPPASVDPQVLRDGDPWVDREQVDHFAGQILIPAPVAVVWEVLTDYENLTNFMPGLRQSRVLDRQGSVVRMEVENVTQVFLSQIPSRVQLQMTEDPMSELGFEMLEGDTLTRLQGRWQLFPATELGLSSQVLLTYEAVARVDVVPMGVFARLFRAQLERDLAAIRAEAIDRL